MILGVDFHGVRLNLQSDHSPLVEYAKEHLRDWTVPAHSEPHLTVQCFWSEGPWEEESNPFFSDASLNPIGRRMWGNSQELIWLNTLRKKGLKLRFRRKAEGDFFDVSYVHHSAEHKKRSIQGYEYRKYFSLMPYLVYFPIAWHLEREKGWTMIHASALSSERRSLIIAGLGGTGKTTACVALMQLPGFELISENIIFTDGDFVYPCYEPIRMYEDSLRMLNHAKQKLRPMEFPEGVREKSLFHFDIPPEAVRTEPEAIFLPQFAGHRYIRELSPAVGMEKLLAMNRLALELDDYLWYVSALDMQWPKAGTALQRLHSLGRFSHGVRWYELGVDRSAGVPAMVEDILQWKR